MVTSGSMRGMTIFEGLYSVFKPTPSRRNHGEEAMRKTTIALAFLVAWFFAMPTGWAQQFDDKGHAELAKALKDAKISLQRGLTASAKEGRGGTHEVGHP